MPEKWGIRPVLESSPTISTFYSSHIPTVCLWLLCISSLTWHHPLLAGKTPSLYEMTPTCVLCTHLSFLCIGCGVIKLPTITLDLSRPNLRFSRKSRLSASSFIVLLGNLRHLIWNSNLINNIYVCSPCPCGLKPGGKIPVQPVVQMLPKYISSPGL